MHPTCVSQRKALQNSNILLHHGKYLWSILPREPLSIGKFIFRNTRVNKQLFLQSQVCCVRASCHWRVSAQAQKGTRLFAAHLSGPVLSMDRMTDIATGSPGFMSSSCAASNGLCTSPEQARGFLAWPGEKISVSFWLNPLKKERGSECWCCWAVSNSVPSWAVLLDAHLTSACLGTVHFAMLGATSASNPKLPPSVGHGTFVQT